jgi:hypothetical protein
MTIEERITSCYSIARSQRLLWSHKSRKILLARGVEERTKYGRRTLYKGVRRGLAGPRALLSFTTFSGSHDQYQDYFLAIVLPLPTRCLKDQGARRKHCWTAHQRPTLNPPSPTSSQLGHVRQKSKVVPGTAAAATASATTSTKLSDSHVVPVVRLEDTVQQENHL